jgi:hypothetical protein
MRRGDNTATDCEGAYTLALAPRKSESELPKHVSYPHHILPLKINDRVDLEPVGRFTP